MMSGGGRLSDVECKLGAEMGYRLNLLAVVETLRLSVQLATCERPISFVRSGRLEAARRNYQKLIAARDGVFASTRDFGLAPRHDFLLYALDQVWRATIRAYANLLAAYENNAWRVAVLALHLDQFCYCCQPRAVAAAAADDDNDDADADIADPDNTDTADTAVVVPDWPKAFARLQSIDALVLYLAYVECHGVSEKLSNGCRVDLRRVEKLLPDVYASTIVSWLTTVATDEPANASCYRCFNPFANNDQLSPGFRHVDQTPSVLRVCGHLVRRACANVGEAAANAAASANGLSTATATDAAAVGSDSGGGAPLTCGSIIVNDDDSGGDLNVDIDGGGNIRREPLPQWDTLAIATIVNEEFEKALRTVTAALNDVDYCSRFYPRVSGGNVHGVNDDDDDNLCLDDLTREAIVMCGAAYIARATYGVSVVNWPKARNVCDRVAQLTVYRWALRIRQRVYARDWTNGGGVAASAFQQLTRLIDNNAVDPSVAFATRRVVTACYDAESTEIVDDLTTTIRRHAIEAKRRALLLHNFSRDRRERDAHDATVARSNAECSSGARTLEAVLNNVRAVERRVNDAKLATATCQLTTAAATAAAAADAVVAAVSTADDTPTATALAAAAKNTRAPYTLTLALMEHVFEARLKTRCVKDRLFLVLATRAAPCNALAITHWAYEKLRFESGSVAEYRKLLVKALLPAEFYAQSGGFRMRETEWFHEFIRFFDLSYGDRMRLEDRFSGNTVPDLRKPWISADKAAAAVIGEPHDGGYYIAGLRGRFYADESESGAADYLTFWRNAAVDALFNSLPDLVNLTSAISRLNVRHQKTNARDRLRLRRIDDTSALLRYDVAGAELRTDGAGGGDADDDGNNRDGENDKIRAFPGIYYFADKNLYFYVDDTPSTNVWASADQYEILAKALCQYGDVAPI